MSPPLDKLEELLREFANLYQKQKDVFEKISAENAVLKNENSMLEKNKKELQEQLTDKYLTIEQLQAELELIKNRSERVIKGDSQISMPDIRAGKMTLVQIKDEFDEDVDKQVIVRNVPFDCVIEYVERVLKYVTVENKDEDFTYSNEGELIVKVASFTKPLPAILELKSKNSKCMFANEYWKDGYTVICEVVVRGWAEVIDNEDISETLKLGVNKLNISDLSADSGVPKTIPNEVLQQILNEELEEPFECIICFEFKDDNNQTDPSKSTFQLNCCSQYLCGACYTSLDNTSSQLALVKTVKCPHCRNDKSKVSKFSRIKATINNMRENTAKKVLKTMDAEDTYQPRVEPEIIKTSVMTFAKDLPIRYSRSLMINGIPLGTFEDELLKFEPFSKCISLTIPEDKNANTNKNFGFAEFLNQQDAVECLTDCRSLHFKGVRLNIKMQKAPRRYQYRISSEESEEFREEHEMYEQYLMLNDFSAGFSLDEVHDGDFQMSTGQMLGWEQY